MLKKLRTAKREGPAEPLTKKLFFSIFGAYGMAAQHKNTYYR